MDNGEVVEDEELILWNGNQPETKLTAGSAPPAIGDGDGGGINKEAGDGEPVAKPNTAAIIRSSLATLRPSSSTILTFGDPQPTPLKKGSSSPVENATTGLLGKDDCSVAFFGALKGMARSQLYEICAANRWNPPIFDCCSEEGPNHLKMFKFKVRVEISREHKATTLVCFSSPFPKKKAAAENAAEGALWFLNHLGYRSKNH